MRTAILLLLALQLSAVYAAEYAVVVAKSSPIEAMNAEKIRDVFLKKRTFDGGNKLLPVNLLGDESVRKQFEVKVLQMQRDEINRYWITNHFKGVSPPVTQASLVSIQKFIEKVDGAIGYLPKDMIDDNLKVVYEF